ncbi:hypothetical protein PFAG_05939, partial [Plasmodium falciparum Santa Lucia]
MVTQNGGGGSSVEEDAKNMFDRIGKQVHDKVKSEAQTYEGDLKGFLTSTTIFGGEKASTLDPCKLESKYTELIKANSNRYPCTNLKGITNEERFSDKIGGQCTKEKISGSTNTCGACAPYRRLHLCDYNLESISNYDSNNARHNLLAEVCMAAKYEGDSIKTHYTPYQQTNKDSASQLCTVLARSFADIGDIVRGKDLYLGNPQESAQRKKLDDKLKTIFKEIYDKLLKDNKTNGKTLQARYGSDAPDYYQLREDWWDANRAKVWEAITCKANGTYFRPTCGGHNENTTFRTPSQCRCGNGDVNIVPTYFDYVPQYLRWFEEWAEDFCRLRKHKLEDAIKKCRPVQNGQPKYCDLNRYDCEKTIRGDHDFVQDEDCKDCQYSCARFVNWIDNQKLEFLKQRKKYETEISNSASCGGSRKKRSATIKYEGYEKEFYEQFKKKGNYGTVEGFLGLLNKEEVCKNFKEKEEGTINFKTVKSSSAKNSDDSNKTFYRTTYCEACPWCGAEQERNGGGWKAKDHERCDPAKGYSGYEDTEIPILTGDKTKGDMVQKYNKFCKNNGKNGVTSGATGATGASGKNGDNITETWTCYYYKKNEKDGGKKDINFCVLQDGKQHTKDRKDKSYNAFFWDWVHDMLIHSIKWRNELGSCINNAKSQNCKNNKCNKECTCFAKWVVKKKTEWTQIKEHFGKQDFGNQGENGGSEMLGVLMRCPDFVLKTVLEKNLLLEIIEGTYGKSKETEHIKALLKEEEAAGGVPGTEQKNIMDKLIEHELQEAEKCKKCEDPPQNPSSVARNENTDDNDRPGVVNNHLSGHGSDSDESGDEAGEEEEEEETEDDTAAKKEEKAKESEPKEAEKEPKERSPEKKDEVDACGIVNTLFTTPGNLTDACNQKYSEPNRYWGWRCVAPSGTTKTSEGGENGGALQRAKRATPGESTTSSDNNGSICIPPRRRKLYVTPLTTWASGGNTQVTQSQAGVEPQARGSETPSQPDPKEALLKAFVESAA